MRNFPRALVLLTVAAMLLIPVPSASSGVPRSSWPQESHDARGISYNPHEHEMMVREVARAEVRQEIPFDWRVESVLAADGDLFVLWGSAFEGSGDQTSQISRITMGGSEVWTAPATNHHHAIGGGVVLTQGSSLSTSCSSVHALSESDGDPLWEAPQLSTLQIVDRDLAFVAEQGWDGGECFPSELVAVDGRTDAERWRAPAATGAAVEYQISVLVGGDLVYVGAPYGAGVLRALDRASGEEMWRFVRTDRLIQPLAVFHGMVFIGVRKSASARARLLAIDPLTQKVVWRRDFTADDLAVSVGGGRMAVGAADSVSGLRLSTGELLWSVPMAGRASEVRGAAGVFYVSQYPDQWVALNGRTGRVVRTFTAEDLIVANGHVVTTLGREVTIWAPPTP
jgi:outer membrane protein assembly factor BamB